VEVGARRRQRTHLDAQTARHGVVRAPHADGVHPGTIAEVQLDASALAQDDREGAGPEPRHQSAGPVVDFGQPCRLLDAVDEHRQAHGGRPALGLEQASGGTRVKGVDGDSVHRVGRDGDNQPSSEGVDGGLE
jgi:hypothetical protein